MKQGSKHLVEFETGKPPKRRLPQSGTIDPGILCADCDGGRLGAFEQYAYELFPPFGKISSIPGCATPKLYELGSVDGHRLNLFLLGQLWKLHVTNHVLGEEVELGTSYEQRFREALLRGQRLASVSCLACVRSEHKYDTIMLGARRIKIEGINCYVVYLPPWRLTIRVDNRPFSENLSGFELSDGRVGVATILDDFSPMERLIIKKLQDQARQKEGLAPF